MHILLYIVLFFRTDSYFTGEVTYQYIGFENHMDSTEFIFGDDFYFERRSGEVLKKRPSLNSDFLVDISKKKTYHIFDDRVECFDRKTTKITTFYDYEVIDTIEYLGHPCKVVTFKLIGTFSSNLVEYRYYYPLDLKLSKQYADIPKFISNKNTIFRPFNEPFVPLYIEIIGSSEHEKKIIKVTKIHKRKVKRKDFFRKLEGEL